jgi:hypothetical protein
MADNFSFKDAAGTSQVFGARDNSGVYSPRHESDSFNVGVTSTTFTRPADTTAYASGDLVANDTTAGSVTPMTFTAARFALGGFKIKRVRLKKSGTVLTNAQFRIHFYRTTITTITNGDNGAWNTSHSGYLGSVDVTMDKAFTDGAQGEAVCDIRGNPASSTTILALLEARAAYVPISGEVFTPTLELERD